MSPIRKKAGAPARTELDAALEALAAEDLRQIIRDVLLELGDRAHARVVGSIVSRAARGGSGWVPAAVSDEEVTEALTFIAAAKRLGQADPAQVDEHLRRGQGALLRKDYAKAHRILGALLPPIGNGDIDLGQHEMVDEVLGTDPHECARQYVVSAYMIAEPTQRAEAVWTAIEEVRGVGHFWEPVRDMERASVEPLPRLDEFLPSWRALVEGKRTGPRKSDWDSDEDRWLREVVQRLDGAAGLARIARSTKRADDLRAWCKFLVDARDWKAALAAFGEAAELVADRDYARSDFLDGAALAAQHLGRNDVPARLQRAWREGPSMLRLRRWLGSSTSAAILRKRVAEALEACPKQAARQRALLHVLARDFVPAAKLLASAPGLGWSGSEHPGHLLFPLLARLMGGSETVVRRGDDDRASELEATFDDLEASLGPDHEPRLATPEIGALLEQAGVADVTDAAARAVLLAAMKKAAENRVAGVTAEKRRRHYSHAADLVAVCVSLDGPSEGARWVAALQDEYRRLPALRRELDRALGAP
jgi:hypothetical protein